MSHRTSLINNEDSSVAQQGTAQAVGTSSALSSPIMQHSAQMSDTETKNTTSTPSSTGAIIAFLNTMNSHYESLSDPVTPQLFAQLCRDYNTGKTDETSFYVAMYRLFFETNATHLVPGLRAFLPATWREVDMEWLHKAVEDDSEWQRASARGSFGELAAMVESKTSVPSTPSGSAVAKKTADVEASDTQPAKNKKRTPLKGFRAKYSPKLETPLSPRSDSDESSTYQSSSASTPPVRRGRPKNKTSSASAKKIRRRKNKSPASTTSALPASDDHDTRTPSPSTPLPTEKGSKLPPASSINHLGSIYPTRRAIMARSHKPYIHALCGMAFGHPTEVQRHHNGQGGRPGCWEKSGKPAGDKGRWDRHDSCKVKLADVQSVKVQEGWVVTSWGSAAGERILREDAGEELEGGTAKSGAGKAEEGKKRKVGVKAQQAPEVESRAKSENEDENMSEDDNVDVEGGEEEVDDHTEPLSPQEPEAKRKKVSKFEKSAVIVPEEHAAAVRAVALGIRTRK